MAISEQFKSLILKKKKMRKLCTSEVGRVKMKKKEKCFAIRKTYFFFCSFLANPLALDFKDDL